MSRHQAHAASAAIRQFPTLFSPRSEIGQPIERRPIRKRRTVVVVNLEGCAHCTSVPINGVQWVLAASCVVVPTRPGVVGKAAPPRGSERASDRLGKIAAAACMWRGPWAHAFPEGGSDRPRHESSCCSSISCCRRRRCQQVQPRGRRPLHHLLLGVGEDVAEDADDEDDGRGGAGARRG